MKKYLIGIFMLIGAIVTITKTSIINADSSFINTKDTVELKSDIKFNIDLSLIDYDVFRLYITSNQSLDTLSLDNIGLIQEEQSMYFDYNINASNVNNLTLNYKLPANTNAGDKITFYFVLVNKENEAEMQEVRKTITVVEPLKEEQPEKPTDNNNNNNNHNKPSGNNQSGSNVNFGGMTGGQSGSKSSFLNSKSITYPGSDNNYLKSLSVSKYSFNRKFSKDGLTYFVTVGHNVTSVKVKATACDSKSKITITGNSNLKVGLNKVLVTVTSESGLTRNYRVYVTREDKTTDNE